MKKNRLLLVFSSVILGLALFFSCQKAEVVNDEGIKGENSLKAAAIISPVLSPVIYDYVVNGTCGIIAEDLIAGQNYLAGKVVISTTLGGKLLISVNTEDPWAFKTIHLFVGVKTDLPVNKSGNPVPGKFPVVRESTEYQTAITFEFNIAEISKDNSGCFIIALHADVYKLDEFDIPTQTETAWAKGERLVVKGNWATYLNYCPVPCSPPGGGGCTEWQKETAFGGETAGAGNAWWFAYNGVLEQKIYAGQSMEIGTVEYDDGKLYIKLTSGWELDPDITESVKIQGYEVLPNKRPAAGLFTGYKGSDLTVGIPTYPWYVIHLDVRKCKSQIEG